MEILSKRSAARAQHFWAGSKPSAFAARLTAKHSPLGSHQRGAGIGISGALAGIIAAFSIVYLGLRGGGYATTVFRPLVVPVWIAVAWICAVNRRRLGRPAVATLTIAASLAVLTAASVFWTRSTDGAFADASRAFLYAGVLALATVGLTNRCSRYAAVAGAAVATGVVAIVALAVGLLPETFGQPITAALLPESRGQLSYPVNYWNGLAAMMAVGAPLVIALASGANRRPIQAAWVAILPALMLTIVLTGSRGGALAAVAGSITVVALAGDRGHSFRVAAIGAAAGSLVIAFALRQDAVGEGLSGSVAQRQGLELLAVLVVVSIVSAIASALASRAAKKSTPPGNSPRPQLVTALGVSLVLGLTCLTALVAASHDDQPAAATAKTDQSQFASTSGRGRPALWHAGLRAVKAEPLLGIGAGSFEQWWSASPESGPFTRNAHSAFVELAAELGMPGLALIVGLLLTGVWLAGRALARDRSPELVAAGGGLVAFVILLSLDWSWEMPAIAATGFLLLGVLASAEEPPGPVARHGFAFASAGLLAAVALAVTLPPHLAETQVRQSQRLFETGQYAESLAAADRALAIVPGSAATGIQRASILKATGQHRLAADQAVAITRDEPNNWRAWLLLAAAAADRGQRDLAQEAYRKSRALNRHGSPAPLAPLAPPD